MAGAFGVGHKVVLHTESLLLLDIDPALWEEGVRAWEHVWVNLVEYGCHADDGLKLSELDCDTHGGNLKGRVVPDFSLRGSSGLWDAYSGWDLPFFVVKGAVTGKALVSSDFTGTKSLSSELEGSSSRIPTREGVASPQTFFDATSLVTNDSVRLLSSVHPITANITYQIRKLF